jgi:hypothetical protein
MENGKRRRAGDMWQLLLLYTYDLLNPNTSNTSINSIQ